MFLSRLPDLCRVTPTAVESVRADDSKLDAAANCIAAFNLLRRDTGIACAAQVWKSDESMMNAQALTETTPATVLGPKGTASPELLFPSVQSGAATAIFVATVRAGGSRLPLFVVVTGSGVRLLLAV